MRRIISFGKTENPETCTSPRQYIPNNFLSYWLSNGIVGGRYGQSDMRA